MDVPSGNHAINESKLVGYRSLGAAHWIVYEMTLDDGNTYEWSCPIDSNSEALWRRVQR